MMRGARRHLGMCAVVVVLSMARPCSGHDNLWRRSHQAISGVERDTLHAVQRVLSGKGEELDLLLVRSATIQLMREQVREPRAVVLLFHLRRQLGFVPPEGGVKRLGAVLSLPMSSYHRALGWYELARLRLDLRWQPRVDEERQQMAGEIRRGLTELERSLSLAWHPSLRTEVLFYRGMFEFVQEHPERAQRDLLAVVDLLDSTVLRRDVYLALGMLHLLAEDWARAGRVLSWAVEQDGRITQGAPAQPFAELPLDPEQRRIVDLSLILARHFDPIKGSLDLDVEACEEMRDLAERTSLGFSRVAHVWLRWCGASNERPQLD